MLLINWKKSTIWKLKPQIQLITLYGKHLFLFKSHVIHWLYINILSLVNKYFYWWANKRGNFSNGIKLTHSAKPAISGGGAGSDKCRIKRHLGDARGKSRPTGIGNSRIQQIGSAWADGTLVVVVERQRRVAGG